MHIDLKHSIIDKLNIWTYYGYTYSLDIVDGLYIHSILSADLSTQIVHEINDRISSSKSIARNNVFYKI